MTKQSKRFPLVAMMLTLALGISTTGCEDEDNVHTLGNWVNLDTNLPGTPRGGAVCFQIERNGEQIAYIGTGANTANTEERERFRDFFQVTPDRKGGITYSGKWINSGEGVSSMPDNAPQRNGAVAFTLNGKGYVGLGYTGTRYLNDFWEFDPAGVPDSAQYNLSEDDPFFGVDTDGDGVKENSYGSYKTYKSTYSQMTDEARENFAKNQTGKWTRVANFPGDTCRYAVAFVLHSNTDNKDYAYVGTGEDGESNYLSDFFRFDGKDWKRVTNCKMPRAQASVFTVTINGTNYAYLVGGVNSGAVATLERFNGDEISDNGQIGVWEQLNKTKDATRETFDDDYTGLAAYGATSFVLPDRQKAYITTGGQGSAGKLTWEYDPIGDYWVQKTSFEGAARRFAVSFVFKQLNPKTGIEQYIPYVTTGTDVALTTTATGGYFYSDTWFFNPYQGWDSHDN